MNIHPDNKPVPEWNQRHVFAWFATVAAGALAITVLDQMGLIFCPDRLFYGPFLLLAPVEYFRVLISITVLVVPSALAAEWMASRWRLGMALRIILASVLVFLVPVAIGYCTGDMNVSVTKRLIDACEDAVTLFSRYFPALLFYIWVSGGAGKISAVRRAVAACFRLPRTTASR